MTESWLRRLAVAWIASAIASISARSQCAPSWNASPNLTAISQIATCFTVFDDGTGPALYAGGSFTVGANVARWDGFAWSAVGTNLFGTVNALCVFDDGTGPHLYAAGRFGGAITNGLAKWNGTSWIGVGPGGPCCGGPPPNVPVWQYLSMVVFDPPGPTPPGLYLGGNFPGGVVRYDASGFASVGFLGTCGAVTCPRVLDLAVYDDGAGPTLFAVGDFTAPSGVARLSAGAAWTALGSGLSNGGFFYTPSADALRVFDDGTGPALYVAGRFNGAGGIPGTQGVARWTAAGWGAVGGGMSVFGDRGYSLIEHDAGNGLELVMGGYFTSVGGVTVDGIAKWNGTSWSSLAPGFGLSPYMPTIYTLGVFDEGNGAALFASGTSTQVSAPPFIKRWTRAAPVLKLKQTAGPGSPAVIQNGELLPGHEYCNVFSLEPCGVVGSGPYGGLCSSNVNSLLNQVMTPVGSVPYHFVSAGGAPVTFGPYAAPPGLIVDALSFDFTGGVVGCISSVQRITVQ